MNVTNVTVQLTVAATTSDANADVVITPDDTDSVVDDHQVDLNVGENTVTVTVTAEDGTTTKAYIITITRASAAAALSALTIDGTSVPGFADATTSYTVDVENATAQVIVEATAFDDRANVSITPDDADTGIDGHQVDLSEGENTVTVNVALTLGAGSITKTYTITINRAAPANVDLSALTIDGTSVTGFAAATTSYTVDVENATAQVIVEATASDGSANVSITPADADTGTTDHEVNLSVGDNTVTVTVVVTTDGVATTKSYIITIKRAVPANANADLSALTIDGTSVTGFAAATTSYTMNVENATAQVTVAATASDTNATVAYSPADADTNTTAHEVDLSVGDTTVTVTVTAEDGIATKAYTVTIKRAVADRTAPSRSSMLVSEDGTTVSIVFNEDLNVSILPAASAFRVTIGMAAGVNPSSVAFDPARADTVALTMDPAIAAGETVSVDYTAPSSGGLQDNSGNKVANFFNRPALNRPAAPVVTLSVGHEKLTVSWDLRGKGGIAITGSRVQWKTADQTWAEAETTGQSDNTSDTRYQITGLTNGTNYTVRVRAANVAGSGPWSEEASGTPLTLDSENADLADLRVENVTVEGFDKNTLEYTLAIVVSSGRFTIHAPTSNDNATVGYRPVTDDADLNTDGQQVAIASALEHRFRIVVTSEDGSVTKTYTLYITAYFPPRAPSGLKAQAADRQVTLSWDAPGSSARHRDNYQYRVSDDGGATWDPDWTDIEGSDATTTSHTVTGLINGTKYKFGVRATVVGTPGGAATVSATAAAYSALVSEDGTTVSIVFDRDLDSSSTPAASAFGVNVGTAAAVNPSSLAFAAQADTLALTMDPAIAAGETVSVDYTAPATGGLQDSSSAKVESFTGQPAFNRPAAPAVTLSVGHQQLSASWDQPAKGGIAITGYDLQWKTADQTWAEAETAGQSDNTSRTRYQITGLTNDTAYTVRVRAANVAGSGPWSEEASETPLTPDNKNADLADLRVENVTVEGFDKNTLEYTLAIVVSSGRFTIHAPTSNDNATVGYRPVTDDADLNTDGQQVAIASALEHRFRIVVTSEDGSVTKTYTLYITAYFLPRAPRGLNAQASYRQVTLSWDAPGSSARHRDNYQYRVSDDGGATWDPDWTDIDGSDETTTSHTLTDLASHKTYKFGVRPTVVGSPGGAATVSGVSATTAVPHDWALRPPGIETGSTFRLLIVTSGSRNATSPNISAYNGHVQSAVASGGHDDIRAYSSEFRALAGTKDGASPRNNTHSNKNSDGPGEQIWWLNGPRAANDYADFYDGNWGHTNPARTEAGRTKTFKAYFPGDNSHAFSDLFVWTGANANGDRAGTRHLGTTDDSQAYVGLPHNRSFPLRGGNVRVGKGAYLRLYGLSPVFRIEPPDAPYATAAAVTTDPANDRDYRAGETIKATVTFSEAVTVTGVPQLPLRIGDNVRNADYAAADSNDTVLSFSYVVTADDSDQDGISIDAFALKLNGGSIKRKDADDVDAALTHTRVRDDDDQLVNRGPRITGVAVTSSPQADSANNTYGVGEDIEITVTFDEAVAVTGAVDFTISVAGAEQAPLVGGDGATELVFAYTVKAGDRDTNGIFIGNHNSDNPTFNLQTGQSIVGAVTGFDAVLEHDEGGRKGSHKVNGSLTAANATLSSLSLSGITLDQTFAAGRESYTASTVVASTTVTATASQSGAGVVIGPMDADTSTSAHDVTLAMGENTVTVTVTATNGASTRTYTVTVNLIDDDLSDLTIEGTSVSGFAANKVSYSMNVAGAVNQVTVAGVASDGNATVTYSPADADAANGHQVDLSGGQNVITVTVTAGDGNSTRAYSVTINRASVPHDWELRPPGIATGSTFRVLIVTSTTRNATSGNIAHYDAHVRSALTNRGHILIRDYSPLFKALAGTKGGASPKGHTDTDPDSDGTGEEIWWLNGPRAANGYADFYDGNWDHSNPARTEAGNNKSFQYSADTVGKNTAVWTGTTSGGDRSDGSHLGTTSTSYNGLLVARFGEPFAKHTVWNDTFRVYVGVNLGLYGLSEALLVEAPDSPYATVAAITTDPANARDYRAGETIKATVTFSEAVTVTGAPQLPLRIGDNVRNAAYTAGDSSDTVLSFSYTVTADDSDADGISIDAFTLKLNGGSIKRKDAGVDAALTHTHVVADDGQRVNQGPRITGVAVTSSPQADSANNTYGVGEDIEITVTFDEAVTVTGAVDFGISVAGARRASLVRGDGAAELVFAYTVKAGDRDDNGIWIGNPSHDTIPTFDLQAGQSIVGAVSGLNAVLKHDIEGTKSGHKVDGSLTDADARLSGLSLSGITLDQTFAGNLTEYTASATAASTTVTATPVQSGAGAVITPADADTGTTDHEVTLAMGDNTVTVTVTASNGTSTRTYTITVTRAATISSDNADLSALTVGGTSVTGFAAATTSYTVDVPYSTARVTVAATKSDTNANVEYSPADADTNTTAHDVDLNVGDNTVTVTVTAQDGTTTKAYTVTINRAEAGNNADLSALTIDGTSVTGFAAPTTSYTVDVLNSVARVTVAATASDTNATVAYSPADADTNTTAHEVDLSVGDNTVTVTVTAQDETTIKAYTVTINRAEAGSGAPSPSSASVSGDGTTVSIVFDGDLHVSSTLAAGEFDVTVGTAAAVNPSGAALSTTDADTVVLTMGATDTIAAGETVSVNYTAPATGGLQDGSGNKVASFITPQAAINRPAAPALTLVPATGQITASWDAPADGGSAITGYDVQYKAAADAGYTTISRADAAATSETIASLVDGTEYTVQVRAVNAAGSGPWAEAATAAGDSYSAPRGPFLFWGNAKVVVRWIPPDGAAADTMLEGWLVQWKTAAQEWSSGRQKSLGKLDSDGNLNFETLVESLSNGTEYEFRVRARVTGRTAVWTDGATTTPNSTDNPVMQIDG